MHSIGDRTSLARPLCFIPPDPDAQIQMRVPGGGAAGQHLPQRVAAHEGVQQPAHLTLVPVLDEQQGGAGAAELAGRDTEGDRNGCPGRPWEGVHGGGGDGVLLAQQEAQLLDVGRGQRPSGGRGWGSPKNPDPPPGREGISGNTPMQDFERFPDSEPGSPTATGPAGFPTPRPRHIATNRHGGNLFIRTK